MLTFSGWCSRSLGGAPVLWVVLPFSGTSITCLLGLWWRQDNAPCRALRQDGDYLFRVIILDISEARGPLARDSIYGFALTSPEAKGKSCSFSLVKVVLSAPPIKSTAINKAWEGG